MPKSGKMSESTRQISDCGSFSISGIKADDLVRSFSENRSEQTSQLVSGANLDEGADSVLIHRVDGFNETDRVRKLIAKQGSDPGKAFGVRTSGCIRIDREDRGFQ